MDAIDTQTTTTTTPTITEPTTDPAKPKAPLGEGVSRYARTEGVSRPEPKVPLSAERLEKLKLARERAVEVRKARAVEKAREKELKQKEYELLKAKNDAKEASFARAEGQQASLRVEGHPKVPELEPEPEPPAKTKPVRKVVVEESDDEVEYVIVKKPKKKVPDEADYVRAGPRPASSLAALRQREQSSLPSERWQSLLGGGHASAHLLDPYAMAQMEVRRDVGLWTASNMRTKIDDIKKEMLLKQLGGGF